MLRPDILYAHFGLVPFFSLDETCHKPLPQALFSSCPVGSREVLLILSKLCIEFIHLSGEEFRSQHRIDPDILFLQRHSCLTGEDEKFAEYIPAAEVQTRVRLGVPCILGAFHHFGECASLSAGVIAENIVEGSAEHCLHLENLITAVHAA